MMMMIVSKSSYTEGRIGIYLVLLLLSLPDIPYESLRRLNPAIGPIRKKE
jgi:hypothetical protein